MPLGLFRGVRTFEVSSDGTGGTAFRVREEYTGALRITFDVACPAGHAFTMWTSRIGT